MKIIAIIGEAGSGKDSVAKALTDVNENTNFIVSATTRPQREGEEDGKDYFFWSYEEFTEAVMNKQMLEATVFNGWGYGTPLIGLDENKINIGVFNPAGIHSLLDFTDIDLTVYYLKVSDKTRLIRQLSRENDPDVDEIVRRYDTDKKDFFNLDFEYIELPNEDYSDFERCIGTISENIV